VIVAIESQRVLRRVIVMRQLAANYYRLAAETGDPGRADYYSYQAGKYVHAIAKLTD
jgi:hypothetical protein